MFKFVRSCLRLIAIFCLVVGLTSFAHAQQFELHKGDHICIVGNTLAERMQLLVEFSDLVLQNHPRVWEPVDAEPAPGRIRVLSIA